MSRNSTVEQEPGETPSEQQARNVSLNRLLLAFFAVFCIAAGFFIVFTLRNRYVDQSQLVAETSALREPIVEAELPSIPMTDVTAAAGVTFTHVNGKGGERLLPETMGGGAGFLDFDNDGDQDLFCVNSCEWPWSKSTAAKPTMHLYSNDGKGKFTDVTEQTGLAATFYGMGPAFGDFDGDGWTDIFITAVGKNRLFRNIEGKKFEEVAEKYGVQGQEDQWSCPAMWFDYDRDGRLDLMVGEYVKWSREHDLQQGFTLSNVSRTYGQPTSFGGTYLKLYHNLGDRFEEVGEKAGIYVRDPNTGVPVAKSLGFALLDVDRDGWMDVVVANDTVQNFLFVNQKNGTFTEQAYVAGVAVDKYGIATGAMGIDVANYRNDDNIAIAIGNFANEPSSLYVSSGKRLQFADQAGLSGFGAQTKSRLTFGLFFADMDLDGRQDIICANGHLEDEISKFQPSQRFEQSPQLFWNAGLGASMELIDLNETKVGREFHRPFVGRAACYADIDSDGDIDVLFVGNGQRAILYQNDQKLNHNWLRVKLKGKAPNTEAIGASLAIEDANETHHRLINPTRSYLSQCELPATFGFGDRKPTQIKIVWPDGAAQQVDITELNKQIVIEQE